MTTFQLTAQQQQDLAQAAQGLDWYVRTQLAPAVAARRAQWTALMPYAPAVPTLAAQQQAAQRTEDTLGRVLAELNAGRAELVPVWPTAEAPTATLSVADSQLAVARSSAQLGWLGAVVGVIGAVVVGGVWYLADLYLSARRAKAEAERLRALTASQGTAAVAAVAHSNPSQATALANALARANAAAGAAQPQDWLSRLSTAASSVPWLALGALLLLGRRRGAR